MLKGDPEVAFGRVSFFWQQRPSPDSLSALVHQAVTSLGVLHTLTTWVGSCREVLDSSLGRGRCLFQIPKPITGSLVACCSACCDSCGNLHPLTAELGTLAQRGGNLSQSQKPVWEPPISSGWFPRKPTLSGCDSESIGVTLRTSADLPMSGTDNLRALCSANCSLGWFILYDCKFW